MTAATFNWPANPWVRSNSRVGLSGRVRLFQTVCWLLGVFRFEAKQPRRRGKQTVFAGRAGTERGAAKTAKSLFRWAGLFWPRFCSCHCNKWTPISRRDKRIIYDSQKDTKFPLQKYLMALVFIIFSPAWFVCFVDTGTNLLLYWYLFLFVLCSNWNCFIFNFVRSVIFIDTFIFHHHFYCSLF